jgi:hypothetical protein
MATDEEMQAVLLLHPKSQACYEAFLAEVLDMRRHDTHSEFPRGNASLLTKPLPHHGTTPLLSE